MKRVIVIGVDFYRDNKFEYYMEELENLVVACNLKVIGRLTQKLPKIEPKYYIGTGKIVELQVLVDDLQPDIIVANNELSGSQNKNIEEILHCKVIDRTQLILEIFSSRAQSKEAKIQVSIAQLKYQKPRMSGSYSHLSGLGGGKAGTVSRGSGETQIEIDKRNILSQISLLEKELEKFVEARKLQRLKREKNILPIVSIVGYTNVGKSTLMNALVNDEKQVFEKNMLFATLDTAIRRIKLDNGLQFLLVDTVGFVSNLPHELIKAFHSTLEEIKNSDLIVHLTDLTNNDYEIHKQVVKDTLKQLNIVNIPELMVNNKVDLVGKVSEGLNISAKNKQGIDKLLIAISDNIFANYKEVKLLIPYSVMKIVTILNEYTSVTPPKYNEKGALIVANLSQWDLAKYQKYIIKE